MSGGYCLARLQGGVKVDANVQIRRGMKGNMLCCDVGARASAETSCLCVEGVVRALQWRNGGKEAEFEAIYAFGFGEGSREKTMEAARKTNHGGARPHRPRKHQTARKHTPATGPTFEGHGASTDGRCLSDSSQAAAFDGRGAVCSWTKLLPSNCSP